MMVPYLFRSRYALLGATIFFCAIPLLLVFWYLTAFDMPHLWTGFFFGISLSIFLAIYLHYNLYRWIAHVKAYSANSYAPTFTVPTPTFIEETQEDSSTSQLDKKDAEIHYLNQEIDKNLAQYEAVFKEYTAYRLEAKEQLEHHNRTIVELKETVADQRSALEKKQGTITYLENKVSDLTYEIKTLLHLAESLSGSPRTNEDRENAPREENESIHYPSVQTENEPEIFYEKQINTAEQASQQLKRCLDMAQKLTGASHFGGSSRLREITMDSFALDLRRLCDSLRSETSCPILLYSPKEESLLFANNQIKNLTGWSPEKFVQNFSEIVQEGMAEWRQGIIKLGPKNESKIRLIIKTKLGQDILVHCHLGAIPTGIFRNNIIGVIYR